MTRWRSLIGLIALLAAFGCGGEEKKEAPAPDVPPADKFFDKSKAPPGGKAPDKTSFG